MSIGSRIKEIRLARGLTQKQLGDLCGMADSAIRRYESDRGNPTEKTLSRIADALQVCISDLMPIEEVIKISPERAVAELVLKFLENDSILNNPESKAAFEDFKKKLGMKIDIRVNEETGEKECDIYLFDNETMLINAYHALNEDGQKEALKRVEELTQIPQYTETPAKEKPSEGEIKPSDDK